MTSSSEPSQETLPLHEWLVICLFIGILAFLTILAWSNAGTSMPAKGEPHHLVSLQISVYIDGAVENPGYYTVDRNITALDAAALATPTPEADLAAIKPDRKVRKNQTLKVPKKKKARKKKASK